MDRTSFKKQAVKTLKKGEILFKQNETSQEFYIIKNGSLRIVRNDNGKELVLDTIGAGMFAGEIAPLDGGVRSATGIAATELEVIVVPQEDFKNILNQIPEWFRKIALILVQRLREADEKISWAATIDHTAQVAALISLVAFSEKCVQTEAGYEIDQKFLEFEIVDMFALALADIQDVLNSLAEKGLIKIQNGKVLLDKRDSLESMGRDVLESRTSDCSPVR